MLDWTLIILIKRKILDLIFTGKVDLAFRKWKRPTVKAGGRLRTAVGELFIDAVETVELSSVTAEEARRAGYLSLDNLKSDLTSRSGGELYRVSLHYHGEDTRIALRENADLSNDQCAELLNQLDHLDASIDIPSFSVSVLKMIARWPERRAQELADEIAMEKPDFKRHVRKLKDKGLTESLPTRYRLSPRGQRFLEILETKDVHGDG